MFKKITVFLFVFLISLPQLKSQTQEAQDTLIVGLNISPPFITEVEGELRGPSLWLWEQVARQHKIHYTLQEMSLDSLLRALETGQVDVSASPLTITSERHEKFDFTLPFYVAYSSVLIPKISAVQKALNFVRSFLSLGFFSALGALAFVILVFGFLEWYFEKNHNKEEFGHGIKGLWNGFWWSAVTMTTVGYGDKTPRTVGGRIVALIWMFTAIIIISGFTASIASSLTVNQMQSDKSALVDFKNKQFGTVESSGTQKWLTDNFYSNVLARANMDELIEALDKNKIDAIAYDRPLLQHLLKNDTLSNYSLLDIKYNPQFYAFGVRKDLQEELKKKISQSMLDHKESKDWEVRLAEYNLKQ